MKTVEVNFDGLVGPTHHYAGLAFGNLASKENAHKISNPKQAALQGLKKMKLLMDLKVPQAVLPPHERPLIQILRSFGFYGKEIDILKSAYTMNPSLFSAIYSASSMWMANAATVSPSIDSQDGRMHLTPANLITHFHRALEAKINYKLFKTIFSDEKYFMIHKPLFSHLNFADEGAANHNRFCSDYGSLGLQVFVYGRQVTISPASMPSRYPARQTLEASQSIARLHQLSEKNILFIKQKPEVIDQGFFHNDVISVVNQNVFLYHEFAFENTKIMLDILKKKVNYPLYLIPVSVAELSLKDAIQSYLFNSQLVTLTDGQMAFIAPIESQENKAAHQTLLRILSENNPIQFLHFVDCRQSMLNGGGPACLRLRVVLTEKELAACHPHVFLTETLYQQLVTWVECHYRDRLSVEDLLDPALLQENHTALDELTRILKLGSIYHFQN